MREASRHEVESYRRHVSELCDEMIDLEQDMRADILDRNSVAWGMCTGAIEVLQLLKRRIDGEEE